MAHETSFPPRLLDGYRSFVDGALSRQQARFRDLAESGQRPETMIIACCDSRAAPEQIFDTIPGEVFVLRNVANLVPPYEPDGAYHSTSAALEFGVQALKVKNIVVMGHARCGGIGAALTPMEKPLSPGDFIGKWMSLLRPAAQKVAAYESMTPTERNTALERISIRHSIDNLRSFPCVRILEEKGRIALHGAWFDIATGELWIMDAQTGDFVRPVLDHEGR